MIDVLPFVQEGIIMKRFAMVAVCLGLVFQVLGAQDTPTASSYRLDHTVVSYRGISKEYAEAIARTVDAVYAEEGEGLWPDRYDYRTDGMARLKREVEMVRGVDIVRSAALWMELLGIVGDKGIAPIFKAWGQANIDPADPGAALRKALLATNPDERLSDWWNQTEPVLVFKRPKSGFAARTLERAELSGQPLGLEQDDGKPAGKRSIAGSGHAVRFQVTGETWYLTAVRIYGSRYGRPAPPKEDFHVWLCDANFKVIADFPFPYAKFTRGAPRWVALSVTPTNVPAKFVVCVGFNPTATKGVYVHHDKEGSGNSLTGLPGGQGRTFSQGDWLIRVDLDQPKSPDPLRAVK